MGRAAARVSIVAGWETPPPMPGGTRRVRVLRRLSVEVRGRGFHREPVPVDVRTAVGDKGVPRDEAGPCGAGGPRRRPHDLMRVHTGGGDGERPPGPLFPAPRSGGIAWAAERFYGPGERVPRSSKRPRTFFRMVRTAC